MKSQIRRSSRLSPFFRMLPVVSLFLVLALLLTACGEVKDPQDPSEPAGPSEPDDPTQPGEPETELKIDEKFTVLRGDNLRENAEACNYIIRAIKEVYGIKVGFETDYLNRGESPREGEKVILIGRTNRPASEALLESLTSRDYAYAIPDSHTIVIAGTTQETTLAGVKKFCEDVMGYTGEGTGNAATLEIGTAYTYRYEYPAKVLTLCGHDVSEYTVLYNNDSSADAAKAYADYLFAFTGVAPKVIKGETAEGYSISFRNTDAIGNLEYQVTVEEGNVVVEASPDNFTKAVELLRSLTTESEVGADKTMAITYEEGTHTRCVLSESEYNDLRLIARVDEQICPGVIYSRLSWTDRNGKPVEGYLMTVAPGAAKVEYGMPNAATEHTGELATVGDQAKSAEEAYGYDIVAAFNASLFNVSNNNLPYGLTYYHGERLSMANGFMCFAVMKDGTFHAGNPTFKDRTQVWNCFSGHYTILEDGKMADHRGIPDNFITIRHPRTAVGYAEDGTLMVLVVDGRQPEISNGASLYDMATIFRSLGAYQAVNLDGGGSSIIYVKDAEGNLTYRNSPSDGHPRKVVDSLLLVRNPDYQGS